jgi:hypothetical protein
MRPPETQRRLGQGAAAVITGKEVGAKHNAPLAYVKRAILLRLIARMVPAGGAPRHAPFRGDRRARV